MDTNTDATLNSTPKLKLIRECRMGPPKCCKTGAVVGTYPKPLLYMQFDREGISVIPSKRTVISPDSIKFDVSYEDIVFIKPGDVGTWLDKPMSAMPKILAIDYTLSQTLDLTSDFRPAQVQKPFTDFITDYNRIAAHIRSGKPLPFKTNVFDSVTGFEDIILSFISSVNPSAMTDARQWASQCGGKVRSTILSMTTWPCHVIFLMHSMIDKNETTGVVNELPSVFSSGLRTDMGGLFSQFFYASKSNGKPVIWPSDKMYVRGVGARWPQGLPAECAPDFNSIYGKEVL